VIPGVVFVGCGGWSVREWGLQYIGEGEFVGGMYWGGIDIDPASRTLRGIKLGLTVVLLSSKNKKNFVESGWCLG